MASETHNISLKASGKPQLQKSELTGISTLYLKEAFKSEAESRREAVGVAAIFEAIRAQFGLSP